MSRTEKDDLPVIILLVQESFERREPPGNDKLEIAELAISQDDRCESGRLAEELLVNRLVADNEVLEDTAVGSVGHF